MVCVFILPGQCKEPGQKTLGSSLEKRSRENSGPAEFLRQEPDLPKEERTRADTERFATQTNNLEFGGISR